MSRITPFDLVFGTHADEWFHGVRREAAADRKAPTDRAQFASLASVQQLVGQIESPEILEANPAAPVEYLLSLYVAFRFWAAGRQVYPIETSTLIDPPERLSGLATPIAVPHGACYLQLAEQAFWGQIDVGAPHEPLDGVFVADSAEGRELTAVAVLGLRPEREGFSQIGITVAHDDVPAAVANGRARRFAPTMEGGERAGFHSLASTSELVCLVQLALAQIPVASPGAS